MSRSSPVPKKAFLLQEVLDKSMLQIFYLVPRIRRSFRVDLPHILFHLLQVACRIINPPKFPCVIAINIRSPSHRKFCSPSVSSIAGLFTKFSAPNVTNRASNSTIDTSTTTWRNSFIRYQENEGYIFAKKDAVHPAPSPSNMLSVR